jgi:hypothetical protein
MDHWTKRKRRQTIAPQIKAKAEQNPEQFVTIDEFAEYTGINPDQIQKYIDD